MPRPCAALATGPMGRSRYCEFVGCRGEAWLAPTLRWRPGLRDEVGTYEFVVCRGEACLAPTLRWRPGLRDEVGTYEFVVCRGDACVAPTLRWRPGRWDEVGTTNLWCVGARHASPLRCAGDRGCGTKQILPLRCVGARHASPSLAVQ